MAGGLALASVTESGKVSVKAALAAVALPRFSIDAVNVTGCPTVIAAAATSDETTRSGPGGCTVSPNTTSLLLAGLASALVVLACALTVSTVPGATLLPICAAMSNTRGTAVAVSTPTFHTGWFAPAIALGAGLALTKFSPPGSVAVSATLLAIVPRVRFSRPTVYVTVCPAPATRWLSGFDRISDVAKSGVLVDVRELLPRC